MIIIIIVYAYFLTSLTISSLSTNFYILDQIGSAATASHQPATLENQMEIGHQLAPYNIPTVSVYGNNNSNASLVQQEFINSGNFIPNYSTSTSIN